MARKRSPPPRPGATEQARERQRRRRQRLAAAGFTPVSLSLPKELLATYGKIARRNKITRAEAMIQALQKQTRVQSRRTRPAMTRRLRKLLVELPPAAETALERLWGTLTSETPSHAAIPKQLEALIASLHPSSTSPPEPTLASEAQRLRELVAKMKAEAGEPPNLKEMVRAGRGPQYQAASAAWREKLRTIQALDAAAAALEQA